MVEGCGPIMGLVRTRGESYRSQIDTRCVRTLETRFDCPVIDAKLVERVDDSLPDDSW